MRKSVSLLAAVLSLAACSDRSPVEPLAPPSEAAKYVATGGTAWCGGVLYQRGYTQTFGGGKFRHTWLFDEYNNKAAVVDVLEGTSARIFISNYVALGQATVGTEGYGMRHCHQLPRDSKGYNVEVRRNGNFWSDGVFITGA
jgi:hypothetical protein